MKFKKVVFIVSCGLLFFIYIVSHIPMFEIFGGVSRSLFYWVLLATLIESVWLFSFNPKNLLFTAVAMFAIGAFLHIIQLPAQSESILRTGFVIWLAGLISYLYLKTSHGN